jgi:hypothetical protein
MARIIGLTGLAGSGKSTVAKRLVDQHGFVLVKFAGPLKAMLEALGVSRHEMEHPDLKTAPCAALGGNTPRWAMQSLGTEWGRQCMGTDFWCRIGMRTAQRVLDEGGSVVFDDVRFPNERDAIQHAGGLVMRVLRHGQESQDGHASEKPLANVNGTFRNQGSIEELYKRVDVVAHLAGVHQDWLEGLSIG